IFDGHLLRRRGLQQLVEGNRMRAAAALLPLLMPAVVHEQPAHRLRSKRQSMRAPLPWPSAFILEAEPRFVYERCRLQRVILPLASEVSPRHAPQLAIHRREHLVGRGAFHHRDPPADVSELRISLRASITGRRSASACFQSSRKRSYAFRAFVVSFDRTAARARPRYESGYSMDAGTSPRWPITAPNSAAAARAFFSRR